MNKIIIFLNALLLLLAADNALAEPGRGFGLNAGAANSSMDGTTIATGATYSYSSSGMSLGIDYQIPVFKSFSINPMLMSSSEDVSGATLQPGLSGGHAILGLQLRYWLADFFIGGQVGVYSEALIASSNNNSGTTTTTDTSAVGSGRGLVIGWEPSKSKWFVMGQVDTADLNNTSTKVKFTGTRVSLGYRWK
jgi:hypothetical protein